MQFKKKEKKEGKKKGEQKEKKFGDMKEFPLAQRQSN